MKLNFRTKIFIYFIAIILFTAIPIEIIIFNYIHTSDKNQMFENNKSQMSQVDNIVSNLFKEIIENNRFLATSGSITKADSSILPLFTMSKETTPKKYSKEIPGIESTIYNTLERYAITHPDAAYVYFGTKWGGYIQYPDGLTVTNYDPRQRPWYTNALKNPGEVAISDPYISSDEMKELIISASSTVKDSDGKILGVLGIDVSLRKLSEIVSNIKIGKTGYVFLFSNDGTILAHPFTNLNLKNIKQLNQDGYSEKRPGGKLTYSIKDYSKLFSENNTAFETTINGKAVLVNTFSSSSTGWKIASVVDKSELLDKAIKARNFILLVTFLSFVFSIILSLVVSKKLTEPIVRLIPLMKEAENGNLTVKIDIPTNDEFGELGNCFNGMIVKLNLNYEELSAVYEELAATEEELRAQYEELSLNQEALRISDERFNLALDGSNDSIWELNLTTGDFFVSPKLYEILGYELNRNLNLICLVNELVHSEDITYVRKAYHDHINNITPIYKSEFRVKVSGNSYIWISCRGKVLRNSYGTAIKLAGSISDISDRKISEEKINFMAYYDALTNLPNRTLFMNRLNDQLLLASVGQAEGAVFFIDLDNFKNINDTMGHEFGDKLLINLADQLSSIKNENDTIGRLGGDEFLLLHPSCHLGDASSCAEKLLDLFNKTFVVDNKQMYITASIGVVLYPKDGLDASNILRNADSAMYKAKELGKNRFALYDEEMYLHLVRKTQIESILRSSIENNELIIYYQPQINAKSGDIYGFEALLRLNSKELGFISPTEFIPIAEETGFITQLDQWVFSEACKQSMKWLKAGYKFSSVSVNISSVEIQQANFLDSIKNIINSTEIDSKLVELEITETVLMKSLDANIKILRELMDMGIRIALDDFGTGYSSLNYLRKIPISTLKIDKSFIDNITDMKEEAIITNIIEMAHAIDLKVVAEGVEKENQLSILKERNCDYIQGYYFSKPVPAREIENLFKAIN